MGNVDERGGSHAHGTHSAGWFARKMGINSLSHCGLILELQKVPKMSSIAEIQTLLNAPSNRHGGHDHDDDLFAVVNSEQIYLGSIARHQLKALVVVVQPSQVNAPLNVLDVCSLNNVAPSMCVFVETIYVDMGRFHQLTLFTV